MSVGAPDRVLTEVTLRDGLRVIVRCVTPGDEGPILEFLENLSVDSRYLRFFSLSPDLARNARSAACAEADRYGLVACRPGSAEILGHAGYWLVGEGRAELAIAVADRFQGRGLGRILLDTIGLEAGQRHVDVLVMDVLPGNAAILTLLRRSRWPLRVVPLPGVLLCELQLRQPSSPLRG